MRLRLRFILFFVGCLILFILFTGLFVLFCSEYLIPLLTGNARVSYVLDISAIILPFLAGGILFGLYFVGPLTYMISLVRELSTGEYNLSEMDSKLYKHNNKLKARYFLYRELISDIYRLAEQLETTEVERKKLEAAKTDWIAGVSHDLKTPLSYITGYSSLLLDDGKSWEKEEQQKFLQQIHDKSVVIRDLIGDLNLSFKMDMLGKEYPLSRNQFDIVDFLKRMLADVVNNPAAAHYEFGFVSDSENIQINADEKLLYRAIQNVVINAVTHNPSGTTVDISVVKETHKQQVTVTVADNGIGMSKETLDNLFSRYYRPEENDNTSGGLGLSLVKAIIEAHGGTVCVESEQGAGTIVKLLLPIA